MLLILDDGSEEALVRENRGQLQAAASARGVRVEKLTTDAPTEVARYASLYLERLVRRRIPPTWPRRGLTPAGSG